MMLIGNMLNNINVRKGDETINNESGNYVKI